MSKADDVVRAVALTGAKVSIVMEVNHELGIPCFAAVLVGPGVPPAPITSDTVFIRTLGGHVIPFFETREAAVAAMVSVVPELMEPLSTPSGATII